MPIEFRCLSCQHMLRTPDESAGKKARCPSCGNIQDVPNDNAAPQPTQTTAAPLSSSEASFGPTSSQPAPAPQPTPLPNFGAPPPASSNPFADNPYTATPTSHGHYPPVSQRVGLSEADARNRLLPPAILMILVHLCSIVFCIFVIGAAIADGDDEGAIVAGVMFGFVGLASLATIGGCFAMIARRVYWLAMATMILNIVLGLTCMIPLPFAIWGLVILVDDRVKGHFR